MATKKNDKSRDLWNKMMDVGALTGDLEHLVRDYKIFCEDYGYSDNFKEFEDVFSSLLVPIMMKTIKPSLQDAEEWKAFTDAHSKKPKASKSKKDIKTPRIKKVEIEKEDKAND